jgi:hypothetical protein
VTYQSIHPNDGNVTRTFPGMTDRSTQVTNPAQQGEDAPPVRAATSRALLKFGGGSSDSYATVRAGASTFFVSFDV